jgi:hypothetical protein
MNRKMQIVLITLCMALLLAWGGLSTASAQVGLKFDHATNPTDAMVCGVIPQANWNRTVLDGTVAEPGSSMLDPKDATGAPVTGMKIEWKTNVGQYNTAMTGASAAFPNRYLFNNALYGSGINRGRISLTGVPYPSYAVIIYNMSRWGIVPEYWDKNGDPATQVWGLNQLATEYVASDGSFVRATGTDAASANLCNYWAFTGITSANVTFNWSCPAQTSVACGIQIVPTTLLPADDPLTDLPILITPTAAQTGVPCRGVPLAWYYRPVTGLGGQFRIYLKAGSAPTGSDVIATLPENPKVCTGATGMPVLAPNTTYYWKVEVFQGAVSRESTVGTFTTAAADDPGITYPSSVTGRVLHLDSTNVDGFSNATLTNGAKVATWVDLSGTVPANDVTQATAVNQPSFLSKGATGLPSVAFTRNTVTAANSTMLASAIPATFNFGTSGFEVYMVSLNAGFPNSYVLGNRSADATVGFHFGYNQGPYARVRDAAYDATVNLAVPNLQSMVAVQCLERAGATVNTYLNNVRTGTVTVLGSPNVVSDRALVIGAARVDGNGALTGQISEVLIYNRNLSTSERTQIFDYLSARHASNTPAISMRLPLAYAQVSNNEATLLRARVYAGAGTTVTKVEYFVNGVLVGTTTAPTPTGNVDYNCGWTPTTVGTKEILAVATASNGRQSAASVLPVQVLETIAPSVAFGTPSPEVSAGPTVDFPTTFTAVQSTFALTADKVTLAASDGTLAGEIEILPGLLSRTPIVRVKNITGYGSLRVCILAGAGTSPHGLGPSPAAISPVARVGVVSVPGAPTTPAGGSALWWDGQDIDGSGNSTLTNGANVATWKDRSGNGNDGLKQASGTGPVFNKTILPLNSKSSVRFPNPASQLNGSLIFTTPLTTIRSVFWVVSTDPEGTSGDYDPLLGNSIGATAGPEWHADPNMVISNYWAHAFAQVTSATPATWRLVGNVFNAGVVDVGPYRHTIVSVDTGGDLPAGYFAGDGRSGYGGSRQFHGWLTEMIIYQRLLTEAERYQTGAYLANKYMMDWPGLRPTPPTVTLVYPVLNAQVLVGDPVELKATASTVAGAYVVGVEFYVNGEPAGTVTQKNSLGQYVLPWSSSTPGRFLVFARALDDRIPSYVGVSAAQNLDVVTPLFAAPVAVGTGDGSSWANAATLDNAITAGKLSGKPIYAKTGTYTPAAQYGFTATAPRLYGGFAGTEAKAEDRVANYQTVNPTTISGGGTHRIINTSVGGIFDGVTFANGYSGPYVNDVAADGGAIRSTAGILTVTNCVIKDNVAGRHAAGILITGGGVAGSLIEGCAFVNNLGRYEGGAFKTDVYETNAVTLRNCTFTNNKSGCGGAIFEYYSFPRVESCVFDGNEAITSETFWGGEDRGGSGHGGAIHTAGTDGVFIHGNKFVNNKAPRSGGAVYGWSNNYSEVVNNVFLNNTASGDEYNFEGGGAMYVGSASWAGPYGAHVWIWNNTFYGNDNVGGSVDGVSWSIDYNAGNSMVQESAIANNLFANHAGTALAIDRTSLPPVPFSLTISNNLFQGQGTGGVAPNALVLPADLTNLTVTGTVTGNPNLVTTTGDIQAGSAAINAGVTGPILGFSAPTSDYIGRARQDTPDIGAYELSAPGALTFTPASLQFGTLLEGMTTTKTVTISVASGNEPITISGGSVTGTGFALVGTPFATPTTLLLGESLAVSVTFTAPAAGVRTNYTGTLSVTNTGTVTPAVCALKAAGALTYLPAAPRPTVTIARSAHTAATTSILPIEFDVVFSAGVTGFAWDDLVWGGGLNPALLTGSIIPVGTDGSRYTVQITAINQVTATLNPSIRAEAAMAVGFEKSQASTPGTPAPTVSYNSSLLAVAIWTTQAPVTDGATVTYTVTFPTAVNGFSETDLVLDPAPAGSTIASVVETNPSTAFTVDVLPGGDGPLCLALNDLDQISKGNDPTAKLNGTGTGVVYGNTTEVDTTTATLVSIKRAFGAPLTTFETIVIFEVKFDDAVTGVDVGDFALTTADATATVSTVAAIDGDTVYVICDTGTTRGIFGLVLSPTAAITDQMTRTVEAPGAPDPLEHFVILNPAVPTAVTDWTLY